MTGNAKPRFLWNGWAPAVVIVVLTAISGVGFALSASARDHAISVVEDESADNDAELRAEQRRADEAICTIAQTNRRALINTLVNVQVLIAGGGSPLDTPEQVEQRQETVAFLQRQIDDARLPFPPPCDSIILS